ncbi:selenide, water dikinase [Vulcanimicrobium alpinum]|uniref:Selenide, water dikinase n=1 Tax=Vulcanimicrobium alpinum TaxID=3016050 RepID=A0AAN1XZU1_UNVUL|nr:selenide, water dikinase SelD [Vulcanimicrobium alpinum]BDE07881.1 selenide, water dikinase [Vulcanimicrobium alpinum]
MIESPGRVRLTSLAACAGCAAKVPASLLASALSALPTSSDPNVLLGIATSDDAGIYRISDDLALVQTVDFFTPIVDDPYEFGRIAAANAISDVYAMGGTPRTALNIAAFPVETLGTEILSAILAGGAAVAAAAGVSIIGGHTIKSDEPKYGMAVTGTISPKAVVTNGGARPGDLLLLSKPIGTGILTTARRNDLIDEAALSPAIASMTRLNDRAASAMLAHGAHAATDVTGFGLAGHAGEIARASNVALAIDAGAVPLFSGVLELIARDVLPGGTRTNLDDHARFVRWSDDVPHALQVAISDAQTSGGLLIAVAPEGAHRILAELADLGTVRIVGEVLAGPAGTVFVR